MKKIALFVAAIATAFVLAACSSQTAPQTSPAASSAQTAPVSGKHHHHDYKGEG